ncbi:MAG: uracil-xanthine permease [Clostridiales bacterium]|nr:uracil-xanthine permease [Clostridiales bacterium]
MNLIYGIKDKPKVGQIIVFAFQQLLAILAATIAVPTIVNGDIAKNAEVFGDVTMSQSAALFGAGVGTLVYLLFTKFRSPVFLGSSFAFLGSMGAAVAGAVSAQAGFAGIILGAIFAGLVYVVIAIVVKIAGVGWINKLMPAVVIGPTVSIIGLSLAGNAVGDLSTGKYMVPMVEKVIENDAIVEKTIKVSAASPYLCLICGLVTLFTVIICSVYGKKMAKLIPFIIGILAGYAVASIFTVIGIKTGNDALRIIDFSVFSNIKPFAIPDFTFITAGVKGFKGLTAGYIASIAVAYIPVAFVVFAEHIADHKNLSSIVGKELLEDPGLHRTLLGDGVGSMAGAIFGGCPNTTYGESIGCVAITGNASVITILATAIMAIVISFFGPFVTFLATIPNCVMGGVCITLYGFIAVSGLKMIQPIDLGKNRNLFVVAVILICGIGGLTVSFGKEDAKITLTAIACALILGIIVNLILPKDKDAVEKEIQE